VLRQRRQVAPVSTPTRRGRPREWQVERIEEELIQLTGGTGPMPSTRELDRAGREDLRAAVVAYGGVRYWAEVIGLELGPGQQAPAPPPEALVEDARKLIGWWGWLPGANKLRQMDQRDLALAVRRSGGARAYCQLYGLPYVDGRTSEVRRREARMLWRDSESDA
jgi:hypothetical protein